MAVTPDRKIRIGQRLGLLAFSLTDAEAILFQAGFVRRPGRDLEYSHPSGAWASISLNPYAGQQNKVSGGAHHEVQCVRVTPADGGYPIEYRQHFAPTFGTLVEVGPAY